MTASTIFPPLALAAALGSALAASTASAQAGEKGAAKEKTWVTVLPRRERLAQLAADRAAAEHK